MLFFITYYCHSYYLRLLKLKSLGKIVASTVFLTVPAALQASFRVKVSPGAASPHQLLQVLLHWLCVSRMLSADKESSQQSSYMLG